MTAGEGWSITLGEGLGLYRGIYGQYLLKADTRGPLLGGEIVGGLVAFAYSPSRCRPRRCRR